MTERQTVHDGDRRRLGDLKAIHAARRQLALDDETYRALVERVSATVGIARRSSAALTARQRHAVLDELRRLGASRKPYPGRPHNADSVAMPATLTKIEAQLADMKAPWSYADAIAQRMFGIARVAWVRKDDHLAAIVAALHVEQEKRGLSDEIDRLLAMLSWPPERVVQLLGPLRPNWRRHRASLRLVHEYLKAQTASAESDGIREL